MFANMKDTTCCAESVIFQYYGVHTSVVLQPFNECNCGRFGSLRHVECCDLVRRDRGKWRICSLTGKPELWRVIGNTRRRARHGIVNANDHSSSRLKSASSSYTSSKKSSRSDLSYGIKIASLQNGQNCTNSTF